MLYWIEQVGLADCRCSHPISERDPNDTKGTFVIGKQAITKRVRTIFPLYNKGFYAENRFQSYTAATLTRMSKTFLSVKCIMCPVLV